MTTSWIFFFTLGYGITSMNDWRISDSTQELSYEQIWRDLVSRQCSFWYSPIYRLMHRLPSANWIPSTASPSVTFSSNTFIATYYRASLAESWVSPGDPPSPPPPATHITCRRWTLACPMVNLNYRSESLLVELENLFALRCLTRELTAISLSLSAFQLIHCL